MNQAQDLTTLLSDLLKHIHVDATCVYNQDDQVIDVSSDDHALLIGKKGENLRAIQYLYNLLRIKKYPDSSFVSIDIEGYKKERLEKVKRIAEEAAAEVLAYGQDKTLPPMNAYERRQVHMVLAEHSDLITESVGQEPHRQIVIKKRS